MSKVKTSSKHDYYKILGVEKDCSEEDIKQSYRKLAKQYHPDLNPKANQAEITTKFQEITEAYEILSNPDKRQQFDAFGESGLNNQTFDQTDSVMNPFDMYLNQFGFFESLFGGKKQQSTAGEPEEEMVISIEATLEELYHGCKREFTKKRKILCRTCNGTGAFSNEHVFYCKACKGTGRRIMRRTLPRNIVQQFSTICMDCEGRGQYITKKCDTCKGRKLVNEVKTITVNIEPGTSDGERIVLKNQGDEWQNKSTGDIIFQVHQLPHNEFERVGDDLLICRTISLLEALTGFNITLNSIEGNTKIVVKVDEVIQPGQKKAIPGKGMPIKGKKGQYGNLVVLFDVIFPEHLNMEMKRYLKILLDPKTKDLKKIPVLDDIIPTNQQGDISPFEINNTKGTDNSSVVSATFLPGHYGSIHVALSPNANQSSTSTASSGDTGIFSFVKQKFSSTLRGLLKKMPCSIYITRHDDLHHLTPKKGDNGENLPPTDKRKKGVNYDITTEEFENMFSKTPPPSESESHKLNPYNNHIEKKDETTFWIFDPTDFDPWFVAKFISEDVPMMIGSYVEFILSTTAPRFCRNIMNALQIAFKFASELGVQCFFKDANKIHAVTSDFLKKILYDPHMAFVKAKQHEWLDRIEIIVEKKMAPLEFPLGNIDMIRDFFAFEIMGIPDILTVFKHLNKNIPPGLSVAALDANIMEIAEFRSATPEERSVSRINFNENYSCLIVDRKCKICKCKVEWDPDARVLRVSPNYLAKPPITGLYRCLPFHSVANCTLTVCKSIMTSLSKPWSDCVLNNRIMTEDFIKRIQDKLRVDPTSIDFYQWIQSKDDEFEI